ncbi:hypothetical protein AB3S75_018603 [Citrus x aurantiifolia]
MHSLYSEIYPRRNSLAMGCPTRFHICQRENQLLGIFNPPHQVALLRIPLATKKFMPKVFQELVFNQDVSVHYQTRMESLMLVFVIDWELQDVKQNCIKLKWK